jgi:alpha-1,2-mannosyltransferase
MFTYRQAGRFANQVATNSSWTNAHIQDLWGNPDSTTKIFPPCDTRDPRESSLVRSDRQNLMISFAQFRPEKDQAL